MQSHIRSDPRRAEPHPTQEPPSRPLASALVLTALVSLILIACSGRQSPLGDDRATGQLGPSPTTSQTEGGPSEDDDTEDDNSDNGDSVALSALDSFGRTEDGDESSNQSDPDPDVSTTPTTAIEPASVVTTTPVLGTPHKKIEEVAEQLAAADPADGDGAALDAVEPLDDKPAAGESQDLREGAHLNETGEQNLFDEAANLACADVEIALTALDEGRPGDAALHIGSAADRTASSGVATMDDWHPILQDTADQINNRGSSDIAALLAFLSTCTQGGYEL